MVVHWSQLLICKYVLVFSVFSDIKPKKYILVLDHQSYKYNLNMSLSFVNFNEIRKSIIR